MSAAVNMNDPHEPLGRALAGSVLTHAAVITGIAAFGFLNVKEHWGSEHASSGSVGVTMVKTIPIPRNQGPTNPLANDTKSIAPQRPVVAKPKPVVVKAPPPDAIPIAHKPEKLMKLTPKQESTTLFKPQDYKPNQVFSRTPQATNSPMFGMQGAGGIDVGPASVLGNRFGAYVDLMRQQISQHWNTSSVTASPSQRCAVTFVIARNGAISNVQITQASGSYLLDTSAKRAVLDSTPLPSLPAQFERNEATVELWFQLNK